MCFLTEILESMEGRMVSINGRHAVKICEDRCGVWRAYRLPGCSLGDYFAALTFLQEKGYDVR